VLDRADAVVVHTRPRARRPAPRPDAYRRGGTRRAPLRSVPQAPSARPAAAGTAPSTARPAAERPNRRGLSALAHRAALWGAGPGGEYLAWPAAAPAAPARRPSVLGRLARRVAFWGAGPAGEYLAWTIAVRRDRRPDTDRPVVLRELPSTPTIRPAASSPAAALLPRGPASSAGPQGARPVAPRAVPVPGVRPRGSAERSEGTGWPAPADRSPAATGLVRARGDPDTPPVRGSPPPARRIRSPGSAWSSFP
jgi:hypothetical protein